MTSDDAERSRRVLSSMLRTVESHQTTLELLVEQVAELRAQVYELERRAGVSL